MKYFALLVSTLALSNAAFASNAAITLDLVNKWSTPLEQCGGTLTLFHQVQTGQYVLVASGISHCTYVNAGGADIVLDGSRGDRGLSSLTIGPETRNYIVTILNEDSSRRDQIIISAQK